MNILFVHQNFPGQFKHLAPALSRSGHHVRAIQITGLEIPGVNSVRYQPKRSSSSSMHPWATDYETKMIRAEACGEIAETMRSGGYRPNVIVGHPGWGEMIFLRDIWPDTPQLHFLEFFYKPDGADVGFDPEFASTDWRSLARVRAKNASGLLNLQTMSAAYSPTHWQRSSYPSALQEKIEVIHDGIDTAKLTPDSTVQVSFGPEGPHLRPGMEVVTFVNRNLEPYRGYHQFMRALPRLQALRPNAIFLLIGGDGVSYGAAPPSGQTWKQIFLDEVRDRIDLSRVHFLGNVTYQMFVALMRISAAHVYLTYPFVLSWSMLEAMSCGALVVGSRTRPVEEVIEHGRNGVLVDFFDHDGLADQVADVLANPDRYHPMRQAARQTVIDRYDLHSNCLPKQMALVERLARS